MKRKAKKLNAKTGTLQSKLLPDQTLIIILPLIVVGTVLRLPNFGESFWYDEVVYATRYWVASLSDLWKVFLTYPSAPLYRLFMFFWTSLFGEHEIIIRLPSLLFGISSIIVSYLIAVTYGSRKMATLAAVLLCLSPVHIWYSQEATPYAMALFFLLATIYVWRQLKIGLSHRVWYTAYPVFSLVAVFTHYYTSIFLLPLSLLSLSAEKPVRRWIIGTHCVVVLCLAAALGTKHMSGSLISGMFFLRPFTLFEWWMLFFNWFSHGNAIWTVNPYQVGRLGPLYLLNHQILLIYQVFLLIILIRGLLPNHGQSTTFQRWELSLLLLSMPLVILFLNQLGYHNLYVERYLFFVLPFFFIVLARGVAGFFNTKIATSCMLIVITVEVVSYGALLYKKDAWTVYKQNPDWRSAASYLSAENGTSDDAVVLVVTPAATLSYYLRRKTPEQHLKILRFSKKDIVPVLLANNIKTFYLVKNYYWSDSFDEAFRRLKAHRHLRLESSQSFKGLDVYTFIHVP
jgi:mannosyltransferase